MPRGLVVMWLAIGSEFPSSNPGNLFFFTFEKFLDSSRTTLYGERVKLQSKKLSKEGRNVKFAYDFTFT